MMESVAKSSNPVIKKRARRKVKDEKSLVNVPSISKTSSFKMPLGKIYIYRLKQIDDDEEEIVVINGKQTFKIECVFEKIEIRFSNPIFYESDGIPKEITTFFENAFKGYYSMMNDYFYVGNPMFVRLLQKACLILKKSLPSLFEKFKYELRFITDLPFLNQNNEQTYYDVIMFIPTIAKCIKTSNEKIIKVGETIRNISSFGQYNTNVVWTSQEYDSTEICQKGAKKIYIKTKVGRNDTCPCGSCIKFKKCCGKM